MPRGTFFMGKVYIFTHMVVVMIFSIEENNVTQAISLSIITFWDLDTEHLNTQVDMFKRGFCNVCIQ